MPHCVLDAPISQLRQRLIDDRPFAGSARRCSATTSATSDGSQASLADRRTADELRRFQVGQQDDGVPMPTMNSIVSALRFFFTHTVDRPDLARKLVRLAHPRKLPVVLRASQKKPACS